MPKPKLAIYWAAACGGCDIAILDIEENILAVADFFDIVFWPVALDFKYDHVRALPDGDITLTLFNGAVRSSENFEMAELLRRKSKVLVAFGSCAGEGCIPALANLTSREEILDYAFRRSPSVDNPAGVLPRAECAVPEGTLHLPEMWDRVCALEDVVPVDYFIPGCPPQSDRIASAVTAVIDILENGKPLPPRGTVLGAGDKTCCDECTRQRDVKKIKEFVRPFAVDIDPDICLMEQGLVCLGPATRAGCGAKCVSANVACRGCYGKPQNVRDQGAKMASALASVIDADDPADVDRIVATIPDPVGTFYRFSMADASLRRGRP